MKTNPVLLLFMIVFLLIAFSVTGCNEEPVIINDLNDEDEDPDEIEEEEPVEVRPESPATYYWPWLSHGNLDLSTGEVISGPDLFESELGFISEFVEGDSYQGRLVWVVEESDVFTLQWVTLSFNVDYFEESDWVADLSFVLEITEFQPEPGDQGIQEFRVNIVEKQNGFEVAVNRILLGKGQEGSIGPDPVDYIALDVEMKALGKP